MRYLALVLCLIPGLAFGQASVRQDGAVTRNDATKWSNDHIVKDAGGLNGDNTGAGVNPFSVQDNNGLGLCLNSAATTGQYNALCLGHDTSSNGIITLQSNGGLPNKGLYFDVNGVSYQFTGNTGIVAVIDNPSLQALASNFAPSVIRADFCAGCGAPPLLYTSSTTPCSLNSGNGDNGSQVKSASGGCWLASFPSAGANAREWGAVGNGSTDDTTTIQAALNWASTSGIPLIFDGTHKFLISTTLTSAGSPVIQGNGSGAFVYTTSCPAGLITNSNITMLSLTGTHAEVKDICIQMATAPNTRTSGAAIVIGGTATTQEGNGLIRRVAILNAYDAIDVGGPTSTTQSNTNIVEGNLIISPSHYGIANGINSTGASTVGTVMRENQIYCVSVSTTATAIALFDGAIAYNGADAGPYACNIGLLVAPGTNQDASGQFTGVLGDTSTSNDALIQPSGAGTVHDMRFSNAWMSAGSSADTPLTINQGTGSVSRVNFSGSRFTAFHPSGTMPALVSLVACNQVNFTGNIFSNTNTGTLTSGIEIGANCSVGTNLVGNTIVKQNGVMTNGILVDASANSFSLFGNMVETSTNALQLSTGVSAFNIVGNYLIAGTNGILNNSSNGASSNILANYGTGLLEQVIRGAATIDCGGITAATANSTGGLFTHC